MVENEQVEGAPSGGGRSAFGSCLLAGRLLRSKTNRARTDRAFFCRSRATPAASPAPEASFTPEPEEPTPPPTPDNEPDRYLTDPVPEGRPEPVEPEETEISDETHTCTLSISCETILNNREALDPDKAELVPEDGWILRPVTVTFYQGESVFNVLQRTCKQQGIHMEFESTVMYHSAYIEGIHNLYQFDCGDLSGWMYSVNGWFPNYGCSRYQLQEGDVICWEYTCDLGADIGKTAE